jgi:hypothetical protein
MSISIDSHSLDLAVVGALVGIKESSGPGMSDTDYAQYLVFFVEALTEILWPGTEYRQDRSSTKKQTSQCLDSTSLQWA